MTLSKQAKMVAVAVGLLAAVAAAAPRGAAAFTDQLNGCVGSVQVPATQGFVTWSYKYLSFPQRFADRSPCSTGKQVISISYRVYGYNFSTGRWERFYIQSQSAPVPAGAKGALVNGVTPGSTYRYVTVDVKIEWRTGTGSLLGSTYVDYNGRADYACYTAGCGVFSGDPNVGAGFDLGF